MADADVTLPGTGTKVDTRTVGAGTDEHRQVMVVGSPTTAANVAEVSSAGALYIQGHQGTANTLNVTTSSSTTGAIAAGNYNVAMISIRGTHAGINLTWETSDDGGTNWFPAQAQQDDTAAATTTSGVITSNASRSWTMTVGAATHIRVRSTAYTSGTGVVTVTLQSMPFETIVSAYIQGTPVVDTELPAAAAIGDTLANPTTPQIASDQMTYNGSTWERQRSVSLTTNVDTSSARTANGNGTALINYSGAKGLSVWVNVTAVSGTTPTCVFRLQWSPDNGTTWIDWDTTNLQSTSITGVSTVLLKVGQAQVNAANATKQDQIPRQVRLAWTIGGTTPSFTFASWFTTTG
jgi:hypothetical protein